MTPRRQNPPQERNSKSPIPPTCRAFQCCVSFYCTAQQASHVHTCTPPFSNLFSFRSPQSSKHTSWHCLHCTAGSDPRSLLGTVCTAQRAPIGDLLLALSALHSGLSSALCSILLLLLSVAQPPLALWDPRGHSTPGDDCASAPPTVCPSSCRFFRECHPAIPSSDGPLLLLPSVFPSIRDVYTMCKTEAIIRSINSVYMPAPISRFPPPPFPLFGVHTFILFVLCICVSISAL